MIKFIFILFFVAVNILNAQVNFSGSLVSNFGESKNSFNFFENRININSDWNNWTAWIEMEHSNPPELGRKNIDLRKMRFEYQSDHFVFKLGDIYEYWGNGLIFNMLDDQSIDLDTGVKGVHISYTNDFINLEYLYGKQRSWRSTIHAPDFDERIPNYQTNYTLNGAKASFGISDIAYDFYLLDVNNKDFKPNILINENTSNELNTLLYGHSFNYSFRNIDSDYHYVVNVDRDGSGHNFNSYIFLDNLSSYL